MCRRGTGFCRYQATPLLSCPFAGTLTARPRAAHAKTTSLQMFFRLITTLLVVDAAVTTVPAGVRFPSRETNGSAMVEPADDLTLRQALALALTQSPELAAYDYGVRIAQARVLQAGLLPNPEAEVFSENLGGSTSAASETTLQLGQLLELGGKRPKRVREARLSRVLAEFDYEIKKREVFLKTHEAFVDVLAGQRAVEVNQEIVELTESVLPDLRRRIEAGKASSLEETRSNAAVATARIGLEQARRDLLTARHRLAAQWGSARPRFGPAVGNLEDAPPIASLDTLSLKLTDHPRIARFAAELAQREATFSLEKAKAIPDVTVHGGFREFGDNGGNSFVIGGSVPLPLFNQNQGNIKAARESIARTEAEKSAAWANISAELAEAYQAVQSARAQIDLFRNTVLPQNEEALKKITEGYNAGRFSYLEFLDAQRTLVTARQQYLQALAAHQHAVARVENLTSRPLHSAHQAPH